MVIIARSAITHFGNLHPDSIDGLLHWFIKTEEADWKNINELKNSFNSVDYVGNDRFVFNIRGNKYRLVAMIFLIHEQYLSALLVPM